MGFTILNAFCARTSVRPPFLLKQAVLTVLCLVFIGSRALGQIFSFVDSPPDDQASLGGCSNYCDRLELQVPAREYNDLIKVRFFPLKLADVTAIFGPKLDQPPADRARPLFAPKMIAESGRVWSDSANHKHVDYHAIGDVAYLEAYYQYDGVTLATCVIYLRTDDQFVPLRSYNDSTNDISKRLTWDLARFATLQQWLNVHMPKLTDLGEVEVSASSPTRIDLGAGTACIVTTRDIHVAEVPYWLSFELAKDTADPAEKKNSLQRISVERRGQSFGFSLDGKFYRLTPKLLPPPPGTNP
jgi:hypothetical protein